MAKLNDKQKLFAKEYLIDRNATKAAERAGYSEKTAGSQGQRLLKNVEIEAYIAKHSKKREERTNVTTDRVIKEIAKVAFADLGLVADWSEDGELKLKAKEDISPEGMAALQSLNVVESFDKDGNSLGTRTNFKMHDKLKALEMLCKHLGILDGAGTSGRDKKSIQQRLFSAIAGVNR